MATLFDGLYEFPEATAVRGKVLRDSATVVSRGGRTPGAREPRLLDERGEPTRGVQPARGGTQHDLATLVG
jgi:hypothetical protein